MFIVLRHHYTYNQYVSCDAENENEMTEFNNEKIELMSEKEWLEAVDSDTAEEAILKLEIQRAEQDQVKIDKIVGEIEAGKHPDKKDIAYLLRLHHRTKIPKLLREYLAQILSAEDL